MNEGQMNIDINGLGCIGKLSVCHDAGRRYFNKIVINIGHEGCMSQAGTCQKMKPNSTYTIQKSYCNENRDSAVIHDIDERTVNIKLSPADHDLYSKHPEENGLTNKELEIEIGKLRERFNISSLWSRWTIA